MEHKQLRFDDYVLTPCKNEFNNKTSYWISREGYTLARYCFTPANELDLKFHLGCINQYKNLFDHMCVPQN